MGKQIEFELKEINTKEAIKDGVENESKSYKYANETYDVELKVKGTMNANQLGLPIDTLDDSILIEFGPKQIQQKLEDDLGVNTKKDNDTKKKTKKTPGRPKKK